MQPDEPKANILLVDDKPENLLALEAILGNLGENLVQANCGEDALRCLLHQDFAVILLDVQMPGMDGFETANLIRSRQRSRQTPIIFLTAFGANDQMQFKGYSLGAVDYLLKPINSDILLSKVNVFVELYKKTETLKQQTALLTAINSELKQSEERFRSISTCSPIGIFETNFEGCCTFANPRYQAICGLTGSSGLTHDLTVDLTELWLQSVHPKDRDRAINSWSSYIKSENSQKEYSQEFRFQTQNECDRWVHVRCTPIFSVTGQLVGHVGTLEDITERINAEETRAQIIREQTARQEAEATSKMKDEFLAVLSHELRTPLTSMLGWAKILRTKKLDEKGIARALEAIERNAMSQAQLIEDILDVSRIIRGKLRLNLCAVSPANVIETALETIRPQAEAKNIQLDIDIDTSLGRVKGDPTRIQQIVWNLFTNAIKFTPNGGRVEVRLQGAEAGQTEVKYAQITVRDTGIGISPDFLPKVFDRFIQADSSTTRSHNGLGLGLAIVRHLVELHGGTIGAESLGEQQGATFIVKLPLLGENASKSAENGSQDINTPSVR
jgi:PAS domain S-box-containing protein